MGDTPTPPSPPGRDRVVDFVSKSLEEVSEAQAVPNELTEEQIQQSAQQLASDLREGAQLDADPLATYDRFQRYEEAASRELTHVTADTPASDVQGLRRFRDWASRQRRKLAAAVILVVVAGIAASLYAGLSDSGGDEQRPTQQAAAVQDGNAAAAQVAAQPGSEPASQPESQPAADEPAAVNPDAAAQQVATDTTHDESAPGHDEGQKRLTRQRLGPWETRIDYTLPVTGGTSDANILRLSTTLGARNTSNESRETGEMDWFLRDANGKKYYVENWAARNVAAGETYYENVEFFVEKGAPNPFVLVFAPKDHSGTTETQVEYEYPENLDTSYGTSP